MPPDPDEYEKKKVCFQGFIFVTTCVIDDLWRLKKLQKLLLRRRLPRHPRRKASSMRSLIPQKILSIRQDSWICMLIVYEQFFTIWIIDRIQAPSKISSPWTPTAVLLQMREAWSFIGRMFERWEVNQGNLFFNILLFYKIVCHLAGLLRHSNQWHQIDQTRYRNSQVWFDAGWRPSLQRNCDDQNRAICSTENWCVSCSSVNTQNMYFNFYSRVHNEAQRRREPAQNDLKPAIVQREPVAVPPELKCGLCNDLLRDAVLTLCCNESFCDECKAVIFAFELVSQFFIFN